MCLSPQFINAENRTLRLITLRPARGGKVKLYHFIARNLFWKNSFQENPNHILDIKFRRVCASVSMSVSVSAHQGVVTPATPPEGKPCISANAREQIPDHDGLWPQSRVHDVHRPHATDHSAFPGLLPLTQDFQEAPVAFPLASHLEPCRTKPERPWGAGAQPGYLGGPPWGSRREPMRALEGLVAPRMLPPTLA